MMDSKRHTEEDLIRGEGEWRNIQLCIRKAFSEQSATIRRQQQQIDALLSGMSTLRSELNAKLEHDHVLDLLETQLCKETHKFAKKKEIDGIKQSLANMQSDIERKPTKHCVEEWLRKKVDKSESLAAFLKTNKDLQLPLNAEISEMKAKFAVLSSQLTNVCDVVQSAARKDDINVLRSQIDHMYSLNAELPSKDYLVSLVEQKVSKADVDVLLYEKLDKAAITATLSKIEESLSEHERIITMLRLRDDSDEVMSSATLSRGNVLLDAAKHFQLDLLSGKQQQQQRKQAQSNSKAASNNNSDRAGKTSPARKRSSSASVSTPLRSGKLTSQTISSSAKLSAAAAGATNRSATALSETEEQDEAAIAMTMGGRGETLDQITASRAAGKLDAMLTTVWKRLNVLAMDNDSMQTTIDKLSIRLIDAEKLIDRAASADKVQTLAIVLEEQRMRTDSILLGSTPIESTARALSRLEGRVEEVFTHLQLPQHRSLPDALHDIKIELHALRSQQNDNSSALSRLHTHCETLSVTTQQCDSRLSGLEELRERFYRHKADVEDLIGRMVAVECKADGISSNKTQIDSLRIQNAHFEVQLHSLQNSAERGEDNIKAVDTLRTKVAMLESDLQTVKALAQTALDTQIDINNIVHDIQHDIQHSESGYNNSNNVDVQSHRERHSDYHQHHQHQQQRHYHEHHQSQYQNYQQQQSNVQRERELGEEEDSMQYVLGSGRVGGSNGVGVDSHSRAAASLAAAPVTAAPINAGSARGGRATGRIATVADYSPVSSLGSAVLSMYSTAQHRQQQPPHHSRLQYSQNELSNNNTNSIDSSSSSNVYPVDAYSAHEQQYRSESATNSGNNAGNGNDPESTAKVHQHQLYPPYPPQQQPLQQQLFQGQGQGQEQCYSRNAGQKQAHVAAAVQAETLRGDRNDDHQLSSSTTDIHAIHRGFLSLSTNNATEIRTAAVVGEQQQQQFAPPPPTAADPSVAIDLRLEQLQQEKERIQSLLHQRKQQQGRR